MQAPKRKPGKYADNTFADLRITQAKYDEMAAEHKRLKAKKPAAAKEVSRLAELGDFSENFEYQQAKRRLRGMNTRLRTLEQKMSHADIITAKNDGRIHIGSTVTVDINGKEKTFTILGSAETDPAHGIISHSSPIGQALIGHVVGDAVEVTRGDRTITFMIVAITSA